MPFDKLDKKAREAAERYNAEYNEEAWSKLEALLDKHMPVTPVQSPAPARKKFHEKWLLLLIGFIIVSSVILFTKPWQNATRDNSVQRSKEISTIKEKNEVPVSIQTNTGNANSAGSSDQSNLQNKSITSVSSNPATGNLLVADKIENHSFSAGHTDKLKVNKGGLIIKIKGGEVADDASDQDVIDNAINVNNFTISNGLSHQKIDSWFDFDHKIQMANNIGATGQSLAADASLIKTSPPKKAAKNNFDNLFIISVSAGPDVSAIDLNNAGTVEILYGAGIGYKFAKKWMVRTGFYSVKKVYGAKPTNYNPPNTFWTYYPNLVDIMANCKVNEIPLIVNYTLSENSKKSWFVSAGLSSYFMKKETYDYRSKSPSTGNIWTKTYTVSNEYKHYLASLRLSAGYEKELSNKISISAEPYINLPLSGIGYGKVKLNSAGILLSLGIKPFSKK